MSTAQKAVEPRSHPDPALDSRPVNGASHAPLSDGLNGGRDHLGRFTQGAPPGPGRTSRQVEQRFLELTYRHCTEADWAEIVQAMVKRAKKGDVRVVEWLSRHLLPPVRTQPGIELHGNTAQRIEQVIDALSGGMLGATEVLVLLKGLALDAQTDAMLYAVTGQVLPRVEP